LAALLARLVLASLAALTRILGLLAWLLLLASLLAALVRVVLLLLITHVRLLERPPAAGITRDPEPAFRLRQLSPITSA